MKTEILLFDEATSALDNKTQSKIQEAISNLKGEYTILIIAHRLSTVINADKIFVIENGMVEEEGTHSYLIKNSKTYNKLYDKERKKRKSLIKPFCFGFNFFFFIFLFFISDFFLIISYFFNNIFIKSIYDT